MKERDKHVVAAWAGASFVIVTVMAILLYIHHTATARSADDFKAWSSECKKADGSIAIKSAGVTSNTYQCVGLDDKAIGLPDIELAG